MSPEEGGGNNPVKWVIGIVVIALIVWAIVYHNQKQNGATQNTNQTAAGDTYKVGVILPLTGDAASYGEPGQNIISMAADEINAAGGVNGKKLELDIQDGKCNGQDASNAMQKLVTIDKVQVVIGGFCSSESLAAEPIAESSKVAMLSPGSSSPKLTGIGEYFSRDYPSDAAQGKVLADVAYNQKGWRKVGFLQEQTDYAAGIYSAFSTEFQKLGGTVTNEQFATADTDFRTQLTKIKNENDNALFLDTQTPASADRVLAQIQQLNWKPQLLLSDVVPEDTTTMSQYKTLLEGTLAAEVGVDPANPKFAHLQQAYKAKYNTDLPYATYGQTEYDSVYLVKDAIAAVGYDGSKIAAWFRTVKDWQGASGAITIGSDGDPVVGHKPMIINNGQLIPLPQ